MSDSSRAAGSAPLSGGAPRRGAPTARSVAAQVLQRAFRDGAFAAAALDAALERELAFDSRDRGLATELVYGVLRTRPLLEARLSRHLAKPFEALPDDAAAHLLIAAYQILFLDRIPAFAAVNEAVDLVSARYGKKGLAGVTNAVLRRLAEEGRLDEAARRTAVAASFPEWLVSSLTASLGAEAGQAFLASTLDVPPAGLRVLVGHDRATVAKDLAEALPTANVRLAPLAPQGILIDHAGDPARIPGFSSTFAVQEEGSQLVALAVGAKPGEKILDACAGRGHKTAVLLDAVGPSGAVYASDVHPKKLERLARTVLAECKLPVAGTFAVDLAIGPGTIPGDLDAVLVDAPCSGVGTLRRRPDLLLRRDAARLDELAALQQKILATSATRVRSGGRLIFAVCSVLRDEAEAVLEDFLASEVGADYIQAPFADPAIDALAAGATTLRLLPTVHGTDGYFVALLRRR